jgi:hypothetical protein
MNSSVVVGGWGLYKDWKIQILIFHFVSGNLKQDNTKNDLTFSLLMGKINGRKENMLIFHVIRIKCNKVTYCIAQCFNYTKSSKKWSYIFKLYLHYEWKIVASDQKTK